MLHAATALGLVMGLAALRLAFGLEGLSLAVCGTTTALMVRLTMSLATRNLPNQAIGTRRLLSWATAMGVLNVPACTLALSCVGGPGPGLRDPAIVLAATVFGSPWGGGLGLLFGMVLSMLVLALEHTRGLPSPAAVDRSVALIGGWVAIVCTSTLVVGVGLEKAATIAMFHRATPMLLPLAGSFAACGVLLTAAALQRYFSRRRWVNAVAKGTIPGWRLIAAPTGAAVHAKLPWLDAHQDTDGTYLLLRQQTSGEGAYRRALTEWPVARVPARWVTTPVESP